MIIINISLSEKKYNMFTGCYNTYKNFHHKRHRTSAK